MEEKKLQEIAEDILLACSLSEDSTVLSQLIEKEFNLKDENDKEKIIELIRRSKQNPLIIGKYYIYIFLLSTKSTNQ